MIRYNANTNSISINDGAGTHHRMMLFILSLNALQGIIAVVRYILNPDENIVFTMFWTVLALISLVLLVYLLVKHSKQIEIPIDQIIKARIKNEFFQKLIVLELKNGKTRIIHHKLKHKSDMTFYKELFESAGIRFEK